MIWAVPLHLVNHPLVQDALMELRDKRTAPPAFRRAANRISVLLAAEALRDVPSTARMVTTPLGDAVGSAVRGDVVVRREVKGPLHRLTVALAEEGLDVLGEADRLLGCGQKDLLYFGLDPSSGWIVGEAAAKNPP